MPRTTTCLAFCGTWFRMNNAFHSKPVSYNPKIDLHCLSIHHSPYSLALHSILENAAGECFGLSMHHDLNTWSLKCLYSKLKHTLRFGFHLKPWTFTYYLLHVFVRFCKSTKANCLQSTFKVQCVTDHKALLEFSLVPYVAII